MYCDFIILFYSKRLVTRSERGLFATTRIPIPIWYSRYGDNIIHTCCAMLFVICYYYYYISINIYYTPPRGRLTLIIHKQGLRGRGRPYTRYGVPIISVYNEYSA